MKRITIFSWGYYGWGNAPEKFVQAVDAVERSRGFKPPLLVEVRIQRTGRAEGFKGSNFEKLLGPKRYKWMKELGNVAVQKRAGPMKIADPSAAGELLDLAMEEADQDRRLLFFCGCRWPKEDGKIACHRTAVTSLLLKAAEKQGVAIEVVEWPGGKPDRLDLTVSQKDFNALLADRWYVPARGMSLADSAGVSWGSMATVNCDELRVDAVVGPARFRQKEWQLPVLWYGAGYTRAGVRHESAMALRAFGLEPRKS